MNINDFIINLLYKVGEIKYTNINDTINININIINNDINMTICE
jgi:hypothetical protein